MDNADMPSGSDNSNNPDDLIAELARLMAAEAKGEPEAETPTPQAAPEPVQMPTPDPTPVAAISEPPRPDPIPRLTPEVAPVAEQPAPSFISPPSARNPEPSPAPSFAPSEPNRVDDALSPVARAQQLSNARQSAQSPLGVTPEPVPPSQARANALDERLTAGIQTTPHSEAGGDAAQRFSPPQAPTLQSHEPQSGESDDPIGALISAQLETITPEEFTEPPMRAPDPAQNRTETAQNDTFGVAPAFNPETDGGQRFQETGKRNPLDDIEGLIGAALKTEPQTTRPNVEANPPAEAQPAVNAPQAEPAPARPSEVAGAASAAEAAILAATQSMQPQNGSASNAPTQDSFAPQFIDPSVDGAGTQTGSRPSRPVAAKGGNWQKIVGPLVAAALLVAVGLGLFWVFGTGNTPEGDAPVLSADAGPSRETPEVTPDTTDAAGSVVLSENEGQAETIERLISRDDTLDAAGNEVSRVISQNDTEDLALANRKVRTVTVRPDGTIVSGDQAVAGGEQLPVDRPNVPQLSAADTPTAVAANQTIAAQPVTQIDNASTSAGTNGVIPPIPLPRPTNRASAPTIAVSQPTTSFTTSAPTNNTNTVNLIANTANQAVSQVQTPTVQRAVTTSGTSAPAYVQLSSQRNQDAADRSLAAVRSQFASQLNGGALEVQEVNLGERGVFYRVRLPAQSIEAANSVCSNIKTAGGDCFVRTD